MPFPRKFRLLLGLSLLALYCADAAAAPGPTSTRAAPGRAALQVFGAAAAPGSRLDGGLAGLARQAAGAAPAADLQQLQALNPMLRLRQRTPLAAPEVLVDAVAQDDAQALRQRLEQLGLDHTAVFANVVGGWLPLDRVTEAGALAELNSMRAARPRTRTGAVTTQGDYAQHSDAARANSAFPNLSGSGITVGVLSDSFDCYATYAADRTPGYARNGFTADYAADRGSGDLPNQVQVLEEANCLDYGAPQQLPLGDEGRAMLQIVHDVAPGAGLAFHTAFQGEADFANGIVALANAGAKVIVDDVGYQDEPIFQDGIVAQAVDQVKAKGVAYFSSAGNDARNSWETTAPAFSVTAAAGANAGERLLDFSGGGTATLPLTIPALQPGEFISLVVEWDEPYVSGAPGSPGAANQLNLCTTDSGGTVQQCSGTNGLGQDPVLFMAIGNPANSGGNTAASHIGIQIGLAAGAAPRRVKFLLEDNGAGASIDAFQTSSPTIQGHPGASGATAVGAAYYLETPGCGVSPAKLEAFSSAGGDPILFDTKGQRLATPELRQKPQFVAPDGGNDTFLGFAVGTVNSPVAQCRNNTAYPSFFGTSAAAPHAGAAAALLLQALPTATPDQITQALQSTALPMGGSSDEVGSGFIQVDLALATLTGTSSCAHASPGASSASASGSSAPPSKNCGQGGGGASPAILPVLSLFALLRRRRRSGRIG